MGILNTAKTSGKSSEKRISKSPDKAAPEVPIIALGKKNKNQYFFTDLGNVSKQVYEVGKNTRERSYLNMGHQGTPVKDLVGLIKLFYFLYLTGARIGEMLRDPKPKILQTFSYKGYTFVKLQRVNEKNFDKYEITGQNSRGRPIYKGIGDREILTVNIPIDDAYDKLMWDYIFDNGANLNVNFLGDFGGYGDRSRISHMISNNFRANLNDGERIHKQSGITPHMLRHMRDFNLRVNKGYEPESVMKIIGWHNEKMMRYYLLINKTLGDNLQLQMFDKHLSYLDLTHTPKFQIGDELSSLTS